MEYAAFPTTTHFVERSVKIYNFCSNKSRSEERVTQLAICYNIVHDVNELTKELLIKEKKDKGKHYKDEAAIKACGKVKNKQLLQNVCTRNKKIGLAFSSFPNLRSTYEEIADVIRYNPKTSFKIERQNDYYGQTTLAMNKARKPSQIEKISGVEFTAAVRNEVRLHDVKKTQKEGIEAELAIRGFVNFSSLPNFTALKNKLKELVAKETNVNKIQDVKFFPIRSGYDWTALTNE